MNLDPFRSMSRPANRRRIVAWGALLGAAAPLLLFWASLLGAFPWSAINCTHQDIDITSGRVRVTRYVLWLRLRDSVEDSALTTALRAGDYATAKPAWHHAVTLSPGLRHSPHYKFHSAIAQIRHLEVVWSLAEFTPAARRASARRMLHLWQEDGNDAGANGYLRALEELAMEDTSGKKTLDERDLPSR